MIHTLSSLNTMQFLFKAVTIFKMAIKDIWMFLLIVFSSLTISNASQLNETIKYSMVQGNTTFLNETCIATTYAVSNLTGDKSSCRLHIVSGLTSYQELDECGQLPEYDYQLLEYNLVFPAYEHSPISLKTHKTYKLNQWEHFFTKHGETLLSLTFNYDILSMSFLSFGVSKKDVSIYDEPACCFQTLTEAAKLAIVKDTLATKLLINPLQDGKVQTNERLCHHIVDDTMKPVALKYECCGYKNKKIGIECSELMKNKWVSYMYQVINCMDILFILFGPLLALKLFGRKSFRVVEYLVKLDEPDVCTIRKQLDNSPSDKNKSILLKVFSKDKTSPKRKLDTSSGNTTHGQYHSCLSKVPSDKQTQVSMKTLIIQVDHRRLMSEQDVAVGPMKFLWTHFILCKLNRYHPFNKCCVQSIFGSWIGNVLCLKIPNDNVCSKISLSLNRRCRFVLTWHRIFRILGMLTAATLLPFPYYIRKIVYYYFEKNEYDARREVIASHEGENSYQLLNLRQDSIQYICDVCYICYWCCMAVLVVVFSLSRARFTQLTTGILQDLKHIQRLQCVRLYFTHLVLPFEKFGLCGFFLGPVYWIISLPIVTCVTIFYCVPMLYLLGRILVGSLPRCVNRFIRPCAAMNSVRENTSSVEKMFLLRSISAAPEYKSSVEPLSKDGRWSQRSQNQYSFIPRFIIGLVLSVCLISVLIMYAECFRFIVEVATLTLMGAIVNAGSAGKFFMLAFFLVTYTFQVFNNVTDKYQKLLSAVFDYIQEKVENSVLDVINLSGSEQKNMAFKYFSSADLDDMVAKRKEACMLHMETTKSDEYWEAKRKQYKDSIEIKKGNLHWKIYSLIFFVDKYDIPRIPKMLFRRIANLRLNGCPGPVYENLLLALKELLYMLFFLFFVMIVVLAFGDAYEVSSGSQLLITLAGGFVPVLATKFLKPKGVKLNLNTYSFQGKINEIIRDFKQYWPMSDLSFEPNLSSSNSEDDIFNPTSCDVTDDVTGAAHVDSRDVEGNTKGEASEGPCSEDEEISGVQINDGEADLVLSVKRLPKRANKDDRKCIIS